MKFILCIFSIYWVLGMFLLPNMDFSALQDIPEQYRHCKETEDKDMTVLDFITDHLINIDSIFDKHQNGDEQKPHKPFHYTQNASTINFANIPRCSIVLIKPFPNLKINPFGLLSFNPYTFNFFSSIFRPPVFSC